MIVIRTPPYMGILKKMFIYIAKFAIKIVKPLYNKRKFNKKKKLKEIESIH